MFTYLFFFIIIFSIFCVFSINSFSSLLFFSCLFCIFFSFPFFKIFSFEVLSTSALSPFFLFHLIFLNQHLRRLFHSYEGALEYFQNRFEHQKLNFVAASQKRFFEICNFYNNY